MILAMAVKTVFVTCGATVPFPQLIHVVLGKALLERLSDAGFRRVIVQYGKGYEAEFRKRLNALECVPAKCSLADSTLGITATGLCCGFYAPGALEVIGLEYSTRVQDIVGLAGLVISHAGTGSILDSLRSGKPLIVCVNDKLMDNHQQQIADKFKQKGYVWACKPCESEVSECLSRSQSETLIRFPQAYSARFENDLKRLAFS
ncbi:hypothetical protein HG536_0E05760 [Torulaspora globosa]|uniref:UDP-N-acetylglucosamine transferase subunit ALG13 n=1 Tax=Torulaspora globosa TaxID=48254 RepID=A0A7G3ZJH9_9SACH|nr:uncharacterized protein HG536_0E05760 [Torulaspora globosa]QLL33665.1 hypothetical protein HG536_0E05760 [Torulaspora globosa]